MIEYIILIILILLFIYYAFYSTSKEKGGWKMCLEYRNRPNHIFTTLLNDNKYYETFKDDWEIYIPCGYNKNELEMVQLNYNNKLKFKNRKIFMINGSDRIVGKTKLWNHLVDMYDRDFSKLIIPETYDLQEPNDIKLFLKIYKKGDYYILKNKLQKQMGVKITNDEKELKNAHKNGHTLIQKFIKEQYQINNYNFNIRIFILVVCNNGKQNVYLYNEGNLRYAPEPFNLENINNKNVITKGVSASASIYKNKPITISDFKQYLNNKNENVNKLFLDIITLIKYVFKALKTNICLLKKVDQATCFQLFGGDFIVDKKLKPYLLEFNKGPELGCVKGINIECELKRKLQKDIFEIVNIIPKKTETNGFTKII
jgi:hypothetical protein